MLGNIIRFFHHHKMRMIGTMLAMIILGSALIPAYASSVGGATDAEAQTMEEPEENSSGGETLMDDSTENSEGKDAEEEEEEEEEDPSSEAAAGGSTEDVPSGPRRVIRSISGSNQVSVGQTITLSSDETGSNHRWVSSNENVATVSGNGTTATVSGVNQGTVTIYHQTRSGGWFSWQTQDDFDVTVLPPTVTFTMNLDNASVRIFHYSGNNLNNLDVSEEFSSNGEYTITYDSSMNNYVVIMAKVPENYLLTGIGAGGSGDFYPVDSNQYGNIDRYPYIHTLTQRYGEGYVAIFGYSRVANQLLPTSISFELHGQSPEISVSAVADKQTELAPGDVVNLELTVTPGSIQGRDVLVDQVSISNLHVGGNLVLIDGNSSVILQKNAQGKYSITVPYTITEADCANPVLSVEVDGATEYEYRVATSDGKNIISKTTVSSSASTSIKIADFRRATYQYEFDESPDHSALTFPAVPTNSTKYYYGRFYTVNVDPNHLVPDGTEIMDSANRGKWVFDGWYRDGVKVTSVQLARNEESGLHFIGHWHFVQTKMDLTITKKVTGNLGDKTKQFPFVVKGENGTLIRSFTLGDEESVTLTDLPIGSTITLAESDNDSYDVTAQYGNFTSDEIFSGDAIPETSSTSSGYSITLEKEKTAVLVTNNLNVEPDTGVVMDSAPYYVLLACLAAFGIGAMWLFRRRRV